MFDILEFIIWVHIVAYILDLFVIAGVTYFFVHNIGISILVAIISYLLMWIKNTFINKKFLS